MSLTSIPSSQKGRLKCGVTAAATVVLMVLFAIPTGCAASENDQLMPEEARQTAIEEFGDVRAIYYAQNIIFHVFSPDPAISRCSWTPFDRWRPLTNPFGRDQFVQGLVHASAVDGDTGLTYDTLIDYFSEEFESDGSLRLWVNGRHPEMAAFMLWADFYREGIRYPGNDRPPPIVVAVSLSDLYRELINDIVAMNPEFQGRGCIPERIVPWECRFDVDLCDLDRSGAFDAFYFLSPMELVELERWHREPGTELDLSSVWRAYPELLEMSETFPCL
ncbi:MAG: hypothetical protein FWD83_04370 [Promicromonosporaceae bacterium]|nr:hypothetical protein [Promicromonosporaceae bacterium]